MTDDPLDRFARGAERRLHHHLGVHPTVVDGVAGARVGVWAPAARSVSFVGDVNDWQPDAHPLVRREGSGVWEGFVPGAASGQAYKLHVVGADGEPVQHADPMAVHAETPPANASKIWDLAYDWGDAPWMATRADRQHRQAPLVICEVHLGSWRRGEDGRRFLTYRELAAPLIEHLTRIGATHVELLPVMEHPFYGSWGYQTTGYFAPTSRYGTPQDLMWLIDQLHQAEIGVILDWVPSHFPDDWWALAQFDGTHLFDHADPRRGRHPDWNSAMFDYAKGEVRSFLISSAMSWLERYHADGLRVDAVSSMLYLDYSRGPGEWEPNIHGGNENLEAIELLRELNAAVHGEYPGVLTFAEEVTAWPGVTADPADGGLGFDLKWDLGWMADTLAYFGQPVAERPGHHDRLTFRSVYYANEAFCLPLSHDEVSHGTGSVLDRLAGDDAAQRANLRALLGYQFTAPGKKLLFMGTEFGQRGAWDVEAALDWDLLGDERHAGLLRFTADAARTYRALPALHVGDAGAEGFAWVDASDRGQSVVSFLRRAPDAADVLVVLNLGGQTRHGYRIGVPAGGWWREVLNSDAVIYGGSGQGNAGGRQADAVGVHGHGWSLELTLPALSVLLLTPG